MGRYLARFRWWATESEGQELGRGEIFPGLQCHVDRNKGKGRTWWNVTCLAVSMFPVGLIRRIPAIGGCTLLKPAHDDCHMMMCPLTILPKLVVPSSSYVYILLSECLKVLPCVESVTSTCITCGALTDFCHISLHSCTAAERGDNASFNATIYHSPSAKRDERVNISELQSIVHAESSLGDDARPSTRLTGAVLRSRSSGGIYCARQR